MGEKKPSFYLMAESQLDRLAYKLLLRHELNIDVAVESDFAPVDIWTAMRTHPQTLLVLADQATGDVRDAVQMVPALDKSTRIIVVSASLDPAVLRGWGQCSLNAYVVKAGGIDELRKALRAVQDGRVYYSPGVQAAIDAGRDNGNRPALSRRESELLPLLAKGLSLRDAAAKLMVSYKTADSYRTTLLRKLGVRDRVELTLYAIREGLIEP